MALNYQAKLQLTPAQGKAGDSITLKAVFSSIEGAIAQVQAAESNYYVTARLLPQGENVYAATMSVPYGAPSGTYTVIVYGVDADGNKGPRATTTFTLQ